MEEIKLSAKEAFFRRRVTQYNEKRYWKYREEITKSIKPGLFHKAAASYKLYYIKRCDAFNNASLGTHLGFGARFLSKPHLPHGLNGIIISHNAVIGHNCTIYHQVTIGEGKGGAPVIGDNVLIGAGAKVIGKCTVGNNVKIGAGAVVAVDIPDNATVVMDKPRIIIKDQDL